jgi:signal transduction histidine kinase
MVRALINLYDNADLHGQGLAGVVVSEHPHHVELHIRDRGPGVAPSDHQRIFERFARAGGAKAGTGSGLGLSIVAQTVTQHGGRVWCTHAEGGESEFVIRLPRHSAREGA